MYYLITISKHKKTDQSTWSELDTMILYLKYIYHYIKVINVGYEYGSMYGQRHVHLIVRSNCALNYKKLISFNSHQFYYDRLYSEADLHNAQLYVTKDQYQKYNFK